MKKNINSEIKRFLTSEVGQTGIRAPLALGVASGAILLSQMVHTPSAEASRACEDHDDCGSDGYCYKWCNEYSDGTCVDEHSECI